MSRFDLTTLLRMGERALIVLGGILSIQAAIHAGNVGTKESRESKRALDENIQKTNKETPVAAAATFFLGVEDPKRKLNKWAARSFFLETRDLLRQLDAGNDPATIKTLSSSLNNKLNSIAMTPEEYQRYQFLTNKADQSIQEQYEFLELEGKLFPLVPLIKIKKVKSILLL